MIDLNTKDLFWEAVDRPYTTEESLQELAEKQEQTNLLLQDILAQLQKNETKVV